MTSTFNIAPPPRMTAPRALIAEMRFPMLAKSPVICFQCGGDIKAMTVLYIAKNAHLVFDIWQPHHLDTACHSNAVDGELVPIRMHCEEKVQVIVGDRFECLGTKSEVKRSTLRADI